MKKDSMHYSRRSKYLESCIGRPQLISRQRLYESIKGACGELTDLAYLFLVTEKDGTKASHTVGHHVGNEIIHKYSLTIPPIFNIFTFDSQTVSYESSGNKTHSSQRRRFTKLNEELYTTVQLYLLLKQNPNPKANSLPVQILGYLNRVPDRDSNESYVIRLTKYIIASGFSHPIEMAKELEKRHNKKIKGLNFEVLTPYFIAHAKKCDP